MKELVLSALEAARKGGADYADARAVALHTQDLQTRDAAVHRLTDAVERGLGVRALVRGAWGFAATATLTPGAAAAAGQRAAELARVSAILLHRPAVLSALDPEEGSWASTCREDPFKLPLEERMAQLLRLDQALLRQPAIQHARAAMRFIREVRLFGNTDGALLQQESVTTGLGFSVTAARGGEVVTRSWPGGPGGRFAQAGYEVIRELALLEAGERLALEARELLDAPLCAPGRRDVILGSAQAAAQLRATCGRSARLEPGGVMTLARLGHLRYGSPEVHISADATLPGGAGSYGWDDEGAPAGRWPIIRAGVLVGALTSREAARAVGLARSQGAMRAASWSEAPQLRVPNLSLEPGEGTLEELIADTREGLLIEAPRSWVGDAGQRALCFEAEVGWEIQGGRRQRMVRSPRYAGGALELWGSCDAVAGAGSWSCWGAPGADGGLEGYAAPPVRLRGVDVQGGGR